MIANETAIQPNSEQGHTLIKDVRQLVESYPRVPITVDCVIFGFDNNELEVLLIRSDIEMYQGKWSLLGDFAHDDEELDDAAYRVLRERTGMDDVYEHRALLFSRPVRFDRSGSVTFTLQQIMRQNPLPGVMQAGIRVEPVGKSVSE